MKKKSKIIYEEDIYPSELWVDRAELSVTMFFKPFHGRMRAHVFFWTNKHDVIVAMNHQSLQ